MVGLDRPVFVLFGSSLVQYSYSVGGWGSILNDLYSRKADFVLRGYAGWNTRRALGVLDQVFPKEDSTQPALVIVLLGGNDSFLPTIDSPHVPFAEFKENLRKITAHLLGLSETTRVLLVTPPPVNERMFEDHKRQVQVLAANRDWVSTFPELLRTQEATKAYAEACKEVAFGFPDVEIVDLFTAIQANLNWENTCLSDGVHLTADGSAIVVKELIKVLKNASWEPSLHWKRMPLQFQGGQIDADMEAVRTREWK